MSHDFLATLGPKTLESNKSALLLNHYHDAQRRGPAWMEHRRQERRRQRAWRRPAASRRIGTRRALRPRRAIGDKRRNDSAAQPGRRPDVRRELLAGGRGRASVRAIRYVTTTLGKEPEAVMSINRDEVGVHVNGTTIDVGVYLPGVKADAQFLTLCRA